MSHTTLYVITKAETEEEAKDNLDSYEGLLFNDIQSSGSDWHECLDMPVFALIEAKEKLLKECNEYEELLKTNFKLLKEKIINVDDDKILETIYQYGYKLRELDTCNLFNMPFYSVIGDCAESINCDDVREHLNDPIGKYVVKVDMHR